MRSVFAPSHRRAVPSPYKQGESAVRMVSASEVCAFCASLRRLRETHKQREKNMSLCSSVKKVRE